MDNIFERVFVIDDICITVDIYKVVFVLCIPKLLNYGKYIICNDNKECQLLVTQPCMTPQQAITNPLPTTYQPLILPSPTPFPPLNKASTQYCNEMFFFTVDLIVIYSFSDVYVNVIDCLLHRIIIRTGSLTRIVLEMTLLMSKQLQYLPFDICNVIEVWILCNCLVVDIVTVYHHSDRIVNASGYTYMILITVDATDRNCIPKSNISNRCSYILSRNGIIQQTLSGTIAMRVMIAHCHKYSLNENQSINKKHNFKLIITVIYVTHSIAYRIEILVAIHAVIDEKSSFMVSHAAVITIQIEFNLYLNETHSVSFYFMTNSIHAFWTFMLVFISIGAIIARIHHVYIILIMMVIINVISIHKLDTNKNDGHKFKKARLIWFCMTAHKIGYIYHFTMDGFDGIYNSSGTPVYFMVIDYNVFKLGLVVSKICKVVQFITITITTATVILLSILLFQVRLLLKELEPLLNDSRLVNNCHGKSDSCSKSKLTFGLADEDDMNINAVFRGHYQKSPYDEYEANITLRDTCIVNG